MPGPVNVRGHVRRVKCLPKPPQKTLEVKSHDEADDEPGASEEVSSTAPADAGTNGEEGD